MLCLRVPIYFTCIILSVCSVWSAAVQLEKWQKDCTELAVHILGGPNCVETWTDCPSSLYRVYIHGGVPSSHAISDLQD